MIHQFGTLEISATRLRHNISLLRERAGRAKLCATIKANAYGHGTALVGSLLLREGVKWACVYSLPEAAELADLPWEGVLVLSPVVLTEDIDAATAAELAQAAGGSTRLNVTDAESARRLSAFARNWADKPLAIHVQVDAGLTRVGVEPREVGEFVDFVAGLPGLRLEGLFAHFSHGDAPGHNAVTQQLATFHAVANPLKQRYPQLMLHVQNSGGAWHLGDAGLDMVRVGIALYGLQPSTDSPIAELQPIARVTAPVLAVHERPTGTGVGYGHTFVTRRPSRLAIVPVGYADGYPRSLSNRGVAQIRGVDVPVVGRVSMDQIILDVTELRDVRPGEKVTVISWDPTKPNALDKMADTVGTIGYELATHWGGRLKRVIVD